MKNLRQGASFFKKKADLRPHVFFSFFNKNLVLRTSIFERILRTLSAVPPIGGQRPAVASLGG